MSEEVEPFISLVTDNDFWLTAHDQAFQPKNGMGTNKSFDFLIFVLHGVM